MSEYNKGYWEDLAACRQADPDLFFSPEGERGASKKLREAKAKEICAGCDVITQCREKSIEVKEKHGVWGGIGEDEREDIIRLAKRAIRN